MGKDKNEEGGDQPHHAFWSTQPMPHGGARTELPEGPIVDSSHLPPIRATPYLMPAGFEWGLVNVHDTEQLAELYKLLTNNYVEDDDALFRFDYKPEFLLWALTPTGFLPDYLVGVFSQSSQKLVAFISGVPATVQVWDQVVRVVEINFLCVHKKLRSKRLAPVLIKEITRRANQNGIFQAVYTAGTILPVPVSSARYYHRSLNPKKLVQVGFSRLPANGRTTLARMCKIYALPSQPVSFTYRENSTSNNTDDDATTTTSGPILRPMESRDVNQVHALLTQYLNKFNLKVLYTPEEVAHWFLPRPHVMDSFVVESRRRNNNDDSAESDGKITDFISFYHLPSSILNRDRETLYAAYSYYNVATSVSLEVLMREALILAKQRGADVFNALDLMDNGPIMEPLKFGIGDGQLQYYIYNWSCPEMKAKQVGLVLL